MIKSFRLLVIDTTFCDWILSSILISHSHRLPLTKVCSHCLATGHLRRSVCTINCGHPFLVKQSWNNQSTLQIIYLFCNTLILLSEIKNMARGISNASACLQHSYSIVLCYVAFGISTEASAPAVLLFLKLTSRAKYFFLYFLSRVSPEKVCIRMYDTIWRPCTVMVHFEYQINVVHFIIGCLIN